MTTERKIEIATAVMNDPRLGKKQEVYIRFIPTGICQLLFIACANDTEHNRMYHQLKKYANSIGVNARDGKFWFGPDNEVQARTERVEFLKKYIEHLKEKENEGLHD